MRKEKEEFVWDVLVESVGIHAAFARRDRTDAGKKGRVVFE
jgi:hypothetical protein